MRHWLTQLTFGLSLGLAARATLPGHHPGSWLAAAALSGIGAFTGRALAAWALPPEMEGGGGFVLAGLGSLAALLFQAVVIR